VRDRAARQELGESDYLFRLIASWVTSSAVVIARALAY